MHQGVRTSPCVTRVPGDACIDIGTLSGRTGHPWGCSMQGEEPWQDPSRSPREWGPGLVPPISCPKVPPASLGQELSPLAQPGPSQEVPDQLLFLARGDRTAPFPSTLPGHSTSRPRPSLDKHNSNSCLVFKQTPSVRTPPALPPSLAATARDSRGTTRDCPHPRGDALPPSYSPASAPQKQARSLVLR